LLICRKKKKNEVVVTCGTSGGEEVSMKCFGGERERNRSLRRPRLRWEYNIKMDLQEIGWENGLD
jgi:hypothetical protein